jgi:hypothetical protein
VQQPKAKFGASLFKNGAMVGQCLGLRAGHEKGRSVEIVARLLLGQFGGGGLQQPLSSATRVEQQSLDLAPSNGEALRSLPTHLDQGCWSLSSGGRWLDEAGGPGLEPLPLPLNVVPPVRLNPVRRRPAASLPHAKSTDKPRKRARTIVCARTAQSHEIGRVYDNHPVRLRGTLLRTDNS